MDQLSVLSFEFWMGFAGGAFSTAFLTQVLKFVIDKCTKGELGNAWKPVIALPAAFFCAWAFESYTSAKTGEPFMWATIGAITLIYAASSAYIYRFILKKFFGRDRILPNT